MHEHEGKSTPGSGDRSPTGKTLRRVLSFLRECNRSPSWRDSVSVALERDVRAALDAANQQTLPLAAVQKLTSARVLELEEENQALSKQLLELGAGVAKLRSYRLSVEGRLAKFERIARELRELKERSIPLENDDDHLDALVRELLDLVPPTDGAHAAVSS